MGIIMENQNKYRKLLPAIGLFIGLPLLLWAMGDFPRKTLLKEFLSLLTILAFCFMLAQFYFTRHNKYFARGREFAMVVKVHRYLGYIFMGILFLHPFLIVVPRFFEAGENPWDAFVTMVTELDSLGVILGLIAYGIMVLIFITTFFRNVFHLQYKIGRMLHGYLSVLFILAAAWHVINIGRHTSTPFSIYFILMAASGIIHLFFTYFLESRKKIES